MKYLLQILSALLYPLLYTGLMYLVILIPLTWILSLSIGWMIVAYVVFGGLIEGAIVLMNSFGLAPFIWINKKNKVSTFISIALCVLFSVWNVISVWGIYSDHGARGVIAAIVFTLLMLQFAVISVVSMIGFVSKEE